MASRDMLRALAAILAGGGAAFQSRDRRRLREEELGLRKRADERAEKYLGLSEENAAFQRQQAETSEARRVRDEANRTNDPLVELASRVVGASADPAAFGATESRPIPARGPKGVAAETIPLATEGGALTPGSGILQSLAARLQGGGDVADLGGLVSQARTGGAAERMVSDFEFERGVSQDIEQRKRTFPQRAEEAEQFALINRRVNPPATAAGGPSNEEIQNTARGLVASGKPLEEVATVLRSRFGIDAYAARGIAKEADLYVNGRPGSPQDALIAEAFKSIIENSRRQ